LASLYQSLGIAYRQRTEQGQAIDYAQEQQLAIDALQAAISRQFPLGESPTLASSLNNLAVLYESQGRYGEAEPLFTQALDLRQRQLGPDHPHTQIVRENLGGLRQQIQATGQTEQSL
jgi:tetratricopeptide (TPR) repeat protein